MGLSPKQRLAFDHAGSDDTVFLASGSVRGGKTAASGAAFGLFCALHEGDHILIGRTEGAAMRNVVRPQPLGLMSAVLAAGWPCKTSGVDGRHVSIDGGRSKIWIFGASDVRAVDRIAGSTFKAGMVDELTRVRSGEDLWAMLWTRFSLPVRKIWATTNPGATRHWVKRLLIDEAERYRARVVSFTMLDNPSLEEDVKAGLAAGLHGHHKRRLIDGLWVDATGLIYPTISDGTMPRVVSHWSIGLDWAASGVFAAVLLAHCADTGIASVVGEREHDHRRLGAIDDAEQAKRTTAWFRAITEDVPGGNAYPVVFGDPTTPTAFQHRLAEQGFHWQDGFNDVLEGIQLVNSGLGSGWLCVSPACTKVRREANEYAWDEKAAERGKDKPQQGADHFLDALRYAWATRSPVVSVRRWH